MPNFDVTEPDFSTELRQLETADPGHANTFNPLYGRLIKNDAYLKEKVDENTQNISDLVTDLTDMATAVSEISNQTYITEKAKQVDLTSLKNDIEILYWMGGI